MRGYVANTDHDWFTFLHFEVSHRLKDEYENGRTYYGYQGKAIHLPARPEDRPDPELLRWHNEAIYERGAA